MIKTFKIGGIHPSAHKITTGQAVVELPVPSKVVIPLSQHIGVAALPMVFKGEAVQVGQLIARSSNFISANIHASVSGVVERIEDSIDASGYKRTAIVIQTKGDEWMANIDRTSTIIKESNFTGKQIIDRIEEAGIVGLGGATFPTHIKLTPPPEKRCDTLIINGAECEPYLTSDDRLMVEQGEELVVGITLLMKALAADKAIIGIENNKPDAITILTDLVKNDSRITVMSLEPRYPQGGEKQLIDSCVNRTVPSGKLPIEVGVVVHNVATVLAVYEAVQKNKPLIDRIVTVTGDDVKHPGNYRVRIGTPISALVEVAGGLPDSTAKVISGGPLMGKALVSLDVPVTKGTSGILLMSAAQTERRPMQHCIRCAKCVSVCPMGLSPYLLMSYSQKSMWDYAEGEQITDCIECGSCSYTCPSNRPLLDYINLGKTKVNNLIRQRQK